MAFLVTSSVIGAIGSNAAADTQASAQNRASDIQKQMFDTINKQEQPFIQSGYGAVGKLNELLGIDTPDQTSAPAPQFGGFPGMPGFDFSGFSMPSGPAAPKQHSAEFGSLLKPFTAQDYLANQDPGYQFQLQTGAQALRNADTPGVGALSGPALKDLMAFNQNMASTGYENAFNRYVTQQNNIFGRLSALAGLGQNAASNTGTAGTNLGIGMAQATAAAGASRAGGIVGATNSLSGLPLAYLMNQGGGGGASFDPNMMASSSDAMLNNDLHVTPIDFGN